MPQWSDQHRIKSNHRIKCNIRRRIENRTHAEIHLAFAQLLQALLASNVIEGQANAWVFPGKLLDGFRQNVLNRRLAGCDRELSLFDVSASRFEVTIERSKAFDKR